MKSKTKLAQIVRIVILQLTFSGCFVTTEYTEPTRCFFELGENDESCELPKEISAGNEHTCVIRENKSVACWGSNEFGQLGIETQGVRVRASHYPRPLPILTNVTQISSGYGHTCAINDDNLYCWGDNRQGQSGIEFDNNSGSEIFIPKEVTVTSTAPKSWQQVVAGGNHTCALSKAVSTGVNPEVYCWGDNRSGQINAESKRAFFTAPQKIEGLDNYKMIQLDAGLNHTCAHDGSNIICWGSPNFGKTGRTFVEGRFLGGGVNQISQAWGTAADIVDISAGYDHSCALVGRGDEGTGEIYCWGGSEGNQLRPLITDSSTTSIPVKSESETDLTSVSAGKHHTCVLGENEQTYCWGGNENYQLGDNTDEDRVTLSSVAGQGNNFVRLSVGGEHACAIVRKTGEVRCWGLNIWGQSGQEYRDGKAGSQKTVRSPEPITLPDARSTEEDAGTPTLDANAPDAEPTDAGVTMDAEVPDAMTSTQSPDSGVAPDASAPDAEPVDAGFVADAAAPDAEPVDAGFVVDAGFAMDASQPDSGVVGDGGLVIHETAAAFVHRCLTAGPERRVYCLGEGKAGNSWGQFGPRITQMSPDFRTAVPFDTNITGVEKLVVGYSLTCGIFDEMGQKIVKCWGDNSFAPRIPQSLGTGWPNDSEPVPVRIQFSNSQNVLDLCSGDGHLCAIQEGSGGTNNTVSCWGRNVYGQSDPTVPVSTSTVIHQSNPYSQVNAPNSIFFMGALPSSANPTKLACGKEHTCVLTDNGEVACWGKNFHRELGGPASNTNIWSGPIRADNPTLFREISAGDGFTCGISVGNELRCWGRSDAMQVAQPASGSTDCPAYLYETYVEVTPGDYRAIFYLDGTTSCEPAGSYSSYPSDMSLEGLTVGWYGSSGCVRVNDSRTNLPTSLKCWGSNSGGQLGAPNPTGQNFDWNTSATVTQTSTNSPSGQIYFENVSVSSSNMCAVVRTQIQPNSARQLYCWGCSYLGEAGSLTQPFTSGGVTCSPNANARIVPLP